MIWWCNVDTINYYTNRNLQKVQMEPEIYNTYFKDKDWNKLDREQFVFEGDTVGELVFKLSPVMISGLLVMPIPYYHNGLVFLQELYLYFTRQSRYIWRGWCAWYDGEEPSEKN